MKFIRPIALLLSLCLCAGCFDITEEFWFNKDHSGRYEMSIDLASMGQMMSMMQQMVPKNDSAGAGPDMPKDTLILLATLPDSIKRRLPFPALADQSSVAMKMQGGFKITFACNFQDVSQIGQFWENFYAMDSVSHDDKLGSMAGFRTILNNVQSDLKWEGKTLRLHAEAAELPGGVNPLGEAGGMDNPMVKMMLGSNKYRQKFHFAGKVKSAKGQGIQRDGKDAWATHPLVDVLEDPGVLSCTIKVKR